tara:strand:- start:1273 stop:1572 length:300 start_codon:yes stop_codon:yes gene_type:complete
MIDKIKAIQSLRPSAEWTMSGDELNWLDTNTTKPTDAEIDAEMTRLQTEYDAKAYQRNRKPEYPDIGDQLDDLFKAGAFSTEMAAKIQAVKDKYPKDNT